jgi:hypothetical protein
MVDRGKNNVTGLVHGHLNWSFRPLTVGEKSFECQFHVPEISQKSVNAASLSSTDPHGRNLFNTVALLDGFHRSLDADLVQRSLPLNRIRNLLAEYLEAKRQVA